MNDPVPLIRDAFRTKIPSAKVSYSEVVRISGVGHECLRKICLDTRADVTIEEAVGDKVPAHIGNTLHLFYEDICRYFIPEYKDAIIETRITNTELGCSGQIDLWDKKNDTIVDFKSTNNSNFRKIQKGEEVSDQYMWQMQGYMMLTGAKHGWFVFIDRDTRLSLSSNLDYHPLFSIYVAKDEKIQDLIMDRLNRVHEYNEKKELPKIPRYFTKASYPCRFCPHIKTCWGN